MTYFVLKNYDQCAYKQTYVFETVEELVEYCDARDIDFLGKAVTDGDWYSFECDDLEKVIRAARAQYERQSIVDQLYVMANCDEMLKRMTL